jgi:hypothetical protein
MFPHRNLYAGAGPLTRVGLLALQIITAAGLAVDAYVHADLAANYDLVGTTITQGTLFRIEAGVSAAAALLVVAVGGRFVYSAAAVVAGSALAVLLLYRYVNVGSIGPVPNMYEPIWYTEKTVAAIAEAAATAAAAILALYAWLGWQRRRTRFHADRAMDAI